ncbi:hypothetical protein [Shewanella sp.]|uniref:hypothetical protein n=1 Tax=Shewanella sp. TaxID=50422 RepID=UPI0040538486
MKLVNACLVLVFTLYSALLSANSLDFSDVVKDVFDSGEVSHAQHSTFWSSLNKESQADAAAFLHSVKGTTLIGQQVQLEVWKSAKASFENQSVTRTDELLALNESLMDSFKSNLQWPEGSANYKAAVSEFEMGIARSAKSTDMILQTAAAGGAITLPDGRELPLNKDNIELIIANISNIFIALNKLFNPKWID